MTTRPLSTMQHAALEQEARDRLGLVVLDDEECWERIESEPVGRVAIVVDGAPHLVPVNHVVRGGEILFVSVAGTKLHGALHAPGQPVAFEVDGYDGATHAGWSVVVHGHLHTVDDLVEHTRHDLRGRPTWLEGYRDRQWLRIAATSVSGRALGVPDDADDDREDRP